MTRCPTCKGNTKFVPGNGPRPCRVMSIAEAPGKLEDWQGKPLVGPTGQEWNETYLPLAGLKREEVYATNARKCRPELNRKPTLTETLDCARHHLPRELAEVQPEVVILMGATACSLIPDIDLDVEHGVPRWGELYGWSGLVVPMWHPALGLHETSAMTMLLEDWSGLREWLRTGVWKWLVDTGKDRNYELAKGTAQLDLYMERYRESKLIAVDTETHGGTPWSVQFSMSPGTAMMIRNTSEKIMKVWVKNVMGFVYYHGSELVFHNAPADLDIVYGLGIQNFRYRDTMVEAYNLGNLPQGLKALSYRLLGRRRPGWEEVVMPPSKEVLGKWIMDAIAHTEAHWQSRVERIGKRGQALKPIITPSDTERTLRSILKHTIESDDYDTWGKLDERMGPMSELIEHLGLVPIKGIAHCRLEEAVAYGCSDADDTLAVALKLEELRGEVGRGVVEEDYDTARCI